ncbi:MAG: MFS transporter [Anaerolineae bacterium]|nr:MFS transporter [Anaerolineae bacterium]
MSNRTRHQALRFIMLLGLVSLMADVTYESARSLIGPYLAVLGASAALVGAIGGIGELIGYSLRPFFGYLADRLRRPWILTILGYAMSVLAVPMLALTRAWPIAAILILIERLGKAVRTPARDTMLSYAASEVGPGKGFGLHEALDQIGAVGGPLLMALILQSTGRYELAFGVLLIPAALTLLILIAARLLYPAPHRLELSPIDPEAVIPRGIARPHFRQYLAFVAFSVAGLVHFQLLSYHLKRTALLPDPAIPALFAAAMLVDAVAGLLFGVLYDRLGLRVLLTIPAFSAAAAPLVFSGHPAPLLLGMMLWGAVIGGQETIMRAAIPSLVALEERGTAYGLFNGIYGLAWFLGSAAMGAIYELSTGGVILLAIVLELIALGVFFRMVRGSPGPRAV